MQLAVGDRRFTYEGLIVSGLDWQSLMAHSIDIFAQALHTASARSP